VLFRSTDGSAPMAIDYFHKMGGTRLHSRPKCGNPINIYFVVVTYSQVQLPGKIAFSLLPVIPQATVAGWKSSKNPQYHQFSQVENGVEKQ